MRTKRLRSIYWRVQWALETLALFRHRIRTFGGEEEMLRERLARREQNFLWSVEHLIFANPRSAYRPLFEVAGYDLAKLRQLVLHRGLDAALDRLWEDGVYVRIGEFKGVEPTVRRGRTFQFQPADFANPLERGILHAESSGSRSHGTRTDVSLENLLDIVRTRGWLLRGYGLDHRDVVLWCSYLLGLFYIVEFTLLGRPPVRWFSLSGTGDWASAYMIRAAHLLTRLPVPQPAAAPAQQVLDVAREISRINTPRGIVVIAFVNPALRLIMAAEEAGIRLGDVTFLIGGEPLTPRKLLRFQERGYKVFSWFGLSEFGPVAWLCPRARESDDLHFLTDRAALRRYSRPVDRDGATVSAYLLTSLLPHTRHVMVNMETGDYGGLEERRCGCFLDRAGFHLHMHTIRSYEKLTAEGMTFVGPTLIRLLEEVLPRQFGGDSQYYQLVEGEDRLGFTRLYVLVSPRLGDIDEEAVRRTVLWEIGERHLAPGTGRLIRQVWDAASTIEVLRREPLATATGKILHLHRDRGALWSGDGHGV